MNTLSIPHTIRSFACRVLALPLLLGGCATVQESRVIQPGDLVQVHFTCRLADGVVVETTDEDAAQKASLDPSPLFRPSSQGYTPVILRAGGPVAGVPLDDRQKHFRDHIAERIAGEVTGLRPGEAGIVRLDDALLPDLRPEDRYLRLARVWRYLKNETVSREEVQKAMGQVPEVGREIPWRAPFTAYVEEVSEHFVRLGIGVPSNAVMETPFGPGNISDGGDRWDVTVDAREGALVRSGPLLGRISEVGEELFTVDFGYAFGNETLFCEVLAEPADAKQTEAFARAVPPEESPNDEAGTLLAETTKAAAEAAGDVQPGLHEASDSKVEETAEAPPAAEEDPGKTEFGDLVEVHYKASLEDGTLVQTSRPDTAGDADVRRVPGYAGPEAAGPVEILAGEKAVFPGLAESVVGMAPGETRTIPLVPDRAFGPSDPGQIETYDAVKRIPRLGAVSAREYQQRFQTFPVKGKTIRFTPYFDSRIVDVREDQVILEALARDGERVENEFGGFTDVRIQGDEVVLQLVPRLGAPFALNDQKKGIVTAYDEKSFTVDYNHPLAGKPMVLEVEVVSLTKASAFRDTAIPWIEDHDQGLKAARDQDKPVFLVLYSPTCGWSQRLLNESVNDPRVKRLSCDFVWVKVDSSQEKDLYAFYEQDGYPLIVLLDPEGDVMEKINGYRPPDALSADLRKALEPWRVGKK